MRWFLLRWLIEVVLLYSLWNQVHWSIFISFAFIFACIEKVFDCFIDVEFQNETHKRLKQE